MKSWSVTILSETSVLKKMNQGAAPDALHRFLTSHYPEAEYYSVYEAGFCGFWIHDRLTELGIHNIVVNPADVPTMSSEKAAEDRRSGQQEIGCQSAGEATERDIYPGQ